MTIVKLPKKFRDICEDIRNGKEEAIEELNHYKPDHFMNQKLAVLAEVDYFNGRFAEGLEKDIKLLDYWDEWPHSNVYTEHVAAMGFAAVKLKRQDEIKKILLEKIHMIETNDDRPQHLKKSMIGYYQLINAYLETGIKGHRENGVLIHKNSEEYCPPETPSSLSLLKEQANRNDGKLLYLAFTKGEMEDFISVYQSSSDSPMWHYKALSVFYYMQEEEAALACIKKIAKQRLWFVSSATQVRPMSLFEHQLTYPFLSNEEQLQEILFAAIEQ
ncbi:hypothetical protein [Isobaculum melis]|uniref:Uncharacterized protein n=1 Tax=Isobaculum melis TaxID=142588 RepID=A0A1H9UEB6_9LACT|nr:hypothetical protein [Isobaculum melis]SES07786.1 hypothetical protein SAMN04488559_12817 [Isobaculum melis]